MKLRGGIIRHHRLCVPKELLLELVVDVCGFQPSQLCSDPEQTLKSSSSDAKSAEGGWNGPVLPSGWPSHHLQPFHLSQRVSFHLTSSENTFVFAVHLPPPSADNQQRFHTGVLHTSLLRLLIQRRGHSVLSSAVVSALLLLVLWSDGLVLTHRRSEAA